MNRERGYEYERDLEPSVQKYSDDTQSFTEVGKTSSSSSQSDGTDSREKLLDDANTLAIDYWDRKRTWGEANDLKRDVIALLDRQAAIDRKEYQAVLEEIQKCMRNGSR